MFRSAFAAPMANPISQEGDIPWYLAGGVAKVNCVAAYQPKGAADLAASYINLANPGTYNAAPGTSGPTWNVTDGWIYPSTGTAILSTGFTIAKTWTVIGRCYVNGGGASTAGRFVDGNNDSYLMYPYNSLAQAGWMLANGSIQFIPSTLGNHVMASSNTSAYLDGSQYAMSAGVYPGGTFYIGNRISDLARQFYGSIQALCIYNITLTSDQILAITNAMNAL